MIDNLTAGILFYTVGLVAMVAYAILWPENITYWPGYTFAVAYIGVLVGILWMVPGVEKTPEF